VFSTPCLLIPERFIKIDCYLLLSHQATEILEAHNREIGVLHSAASKVSDNHHTVLDDMMEGISITFTFSEQDIAALQFFADESIISELQISDIKDE